VAELKRQGVGNKVIADMFGLALRGYHAKISRLQESATYGGRSLWEAVLEFTQERGTVSQTEVLTRFRGDDELTVRGVISDLVDSGLLFRSGKGERTVYRAASADEVDLRNQETGDEGVANLVWVGVNRIGSATREELMALVPIDEAKLTSALQYLLHEGRVTLVTSDDSVRYSCNGCFIPLGERHGWEAAVFDHYQALVTAVCAKLNTGALRGAADDHIGGSTYTFCIWDGHPMSDQVLGFLGTVRSQAMSLRREVAAYNEQSSYPPDRMRRVVAYVGQSVIEAEAGMNE
jgi:hypothetical protein